MQESLRVRAVLTSLTLSDVDDETYGYFIMHNITKTKERIKNYIPLYVMCTGRITFMLYHKERIIH
jgi:hypothetical protein